MWKALVAVGCWTAMVASGAQAAELVRLQHPKHRMNNPMLFETPAQAVTRDFTKALCVLRVGAWVNLIEYGPKVSKVATRSLGSSRCEGYVDSQFVVRR